MCPILPASPETPITAMDREWKNGSRVLTEGAFTPRVNVNHPCDREQARVARRRRWLYGLRGRCSKTLQFRDPGICLSTNRLFSESLVRGQHFALHTGSHRGTTLCETRPNMKSAILNFLSVLGSTAFSLTSVGIAEAGNSKKKAVAEPSTFVLLSVGAGALAWWKLRRK
jgi:hypothetical protein